MVLNIDSNDFRGIRVAMKDWLPSLSTVSVIEMDAIPSLLYYLSVFIDVLILHALKKKEPRVYPRFFFRCFVSELYLLGAIQCIHKIYYNYVVFTACIRQLI